MLYSCVCVEGSVSYSQELCYAQPGNVRVSGRNGNITVMDNSAVQHLPSRASCSRAERGK